MILVPADSFRLRTQRDVKLRGVSITAMALVLPLVLVVAGCTRATAQREPEHPHIFLIVVDALRADHLPRWGDTRVKTPNLDRFFSRAAVFENTRSQAACTFPSVNSLLTSRYPFEFISRGLKPQEPAQSMSAREVEKLWQSANRPAHFGIPDDLASLPKVLEGMGYTTVAVSASPIVRNLPDERATNQWGGFGGGFFQFHEACLRQPADCVNNAAFEILDKLDAGRPLFAYLHYMEPHDPYQAPDGARGRFSGSYEPEKEYIAKGNPYPIARILRNEPEKIGDIDRRDIVHLKDLYDEEIEYFDAKFGELVSRLERRSLFDDSIVVVLADHGEAFLENGFMVHCYSSFDTEVHVPLAVRVPELRTGRRVEAPVGLIDVAPTLVELAGDEPEKYGFSGRSLLPLIRGTAGAVELEDAGDGLVFSAQRGFRSVAGRRWKVVLNLQTGEASLFDIVTDPREQDDVKAANPERFAELAARLHDFLVRTEGKSYRSESVGFGEAVEDQLRALGYME